MADYKFYREGGNLYCDVRGKKHLVVEVEGLRFLVPMSIARSADMLASAKQLFKEQAVLYKELMAKGVPPEEAVKVLAIGSLYGLEFGEEPIGDILMVPKAENET